jgi:hypothetical protein
MVGQRSSEKPLHLGHLELRDAGPKRNYLSGSSSRDSDDLGDPANATDLY